jgi:hypothetical protein
VSITHKYTTKRSDIDINRNQKVTRHTSGIENKRKKTKAKNDPVKNSTKEKKMNEAI